MSGLTPSLLFMNITVMVVMIKMLRMNGRYICHMMTMVTLWMSLTSRLGEKTFWFRPNKSHPLWLSLSGWSLKLGPVWKLTNTVFEINFEKIMTGVKISHSVGISCKKYRHCRGWASWERQLINPATPLPFLASLNRQKERPVRLFHGEKRVKFALGCDPGWPRGGDFKHESKSRAPCKVRGSFFYEITNIVETLERTKCHCNWRKIPEG